MANRLVTITGANGFVGMHLCEAAHNAGWQVRALVRSDASNLSDDIDILTGFELDKKNDWVNALQDTDTLIHCAGIAHKSFKNPDDALVAFDHVNHKAAIQIAEAAVAAGVRRFIFFSSAAVYGSQKDPKLNRESDTCYPTDPYGISKLAAEQALEQISRRSKMELVIIRPPLIYGPKCPGNFARLVKLVRTGMPLPFGQIHARRSFLSIFNLRDFIVKVCNFDADASGIYNLADSRPIDIREVIEAVCIGAKCPVRIFSVPDRAFKALLTLFGKDELNKKINSGTIVATSAAISKFSWGPIVSSKEGMSIAAKSFVE